MLTTRDGVMEKSSDLASRDDRTSRTEAAAISEFYNLTEIME